MPAVAVVISKGEPAHPPRRRPWRPAHLCRQTIEGFGELFRGASPLKTIGTNQPAVALPAGVANATCDLRVCRDHPDAVTTASGPADQRPTRWRLPAPAIGSATLATAAEDPSKLKIGWLPRSLVNLSQ